MRRLRQEKPHSLSKAPVSQRPVPLQIPRTGPSGVLPFLLCLPICLRQQLRGSCFEVSQLLPPLTPLPALLSHYHSQSKSQSLDQHTGGQSHDCWAPPDLRPHLRPLPSLLHAATVLLLLMACCPPYKPVLCPAADRQAGKAQCSSGGKGCSCGSKSHRKATLRDFLCFHCHLRKS